jgi:hypothetical protein
MTWLWISIPIETVFFLTCTVIPIWLGFGRPDRELEAASAAPRPLLESARR